MRDSHDSAAPVCFYWFALRTCIVSLAIIDGWHEMDTLSNPWTVLVDGTLAGFMYFLQGKLDEAISSMRP